MLCVLPVNDADALFTQRSSDSDAQDDPEIITVFLHRSNVLHNDPKLDASPIVVLFLTNRPKFMEKTGIRSEHVIDVTIAFKLPDPAQRRCIIDFHTAA